MTPLERTLTLTVPSVSPVANCAKAATISAAVGSSWRSRLRAPAASVHAANGAPTSARPYAGCDVPRRRAAGCGLPRRGCWRCPRSCHLRPRPRSPTSTGPVSRPRLMAQFQAILCRDTSDRARPGRRRFPGGTADAHAGAQERSSWCTFTPPPDGPCLTQPQRSRRTAECSRATCRPALRAGRRQARACGYGPTAS